MNITRVSSRELNQDISRAKNATRTGSVIITYRCTASHVLLSIEEYQRLTKQRLSIADALGMPEVSDIELDPPIVSVGTPQANIL